MEGRRASALRQQVVADDREAVVVKSVKVVRM